MSKTKKKKEKEIPLYENYFQPVSSEEDLEMIEDAIEDGALSLDELPDLLL